MKLKIMSLLAIGSAVTQSKVIHNYFERVDTCIKAIHKFRVTD